MRMLKWTSLAAGTLALLVLQPAFAEDLPQEARWYVGGSLGGSRFDMDDEARQIDDDVVQGGLAASSSSSVIDKSDSGLKAYGGYRWTKNFGVEFGFISPGQGTIRTQVPGQVYVGKGEVSGWFGEFVGTLPLGKGFSLHAKGGPFAWRFDGELDSTTTNNSLVKKNDGVDFTFGGGVGYEINEWLGARFEYERFQFEENHFDFISAGLLVRF